jgi:hypothetical protein
VNWCSIKSYSSVSTIFKYCHQLEVVWLVKTWLLKNSVFCATTTCDSFKNRRFGGTYRFHHQVKRSELQSIFLRILLQLLVTANVFRGLLIPFDLIMVAIISSETSILKKPHGLPSHKKQFFIVTVVKGGFGLVTWFICFSYNHDKLQSLEIPSSSPRTSILSCLGPSVWLFLYLELASLATDST